jgi:hypothetical protein
MQAVPAIRFACLDEHPKVGELAEGYQEISSSEGGLVLESQWFELILEALMTPDGWQAVTTAFVL